MSAVEEMRSIELGDLRTLGTHSVPSEKPRNLCLKIYSIVLTVLVLSICVTYVVRPQLVVGVLTYGAEMNIEAMPLRLLDILSASSPPTNDASGNLKKVIVQDLNGTIDGKTLDLGASLFFVANSPMFHFHGDNVTEVDIGFLTKYGFPTATDCLKVNVTKMNQQNYERKMTLAEHGGFRSGANVTFQFDAPVTDFSIELGYSIDEALYLEEALGLSYTQPNILRLTSFMQDVWYKYVREVVPLLDESDPIRHLTRDEFAVLSNRYRALFN